MEIDGTETEKVVEPDEKQEDIESVIEIDWNNVDIPLEAIKETPAYKKVLEESISRRHKIKEIEKQLGELENVAQEGDTPEEAQPQVATNVEELVNRVVKALEPKFQQLDTLSTDIAAKAEQTESTRLQTEYNLSKDDATLMRELPQTNWETFAKRVGTRAVDETSKGGSDTSKENQIIAALKARDNSFINPESPGNASPLNSDFQKSKGGGYDSVVQK